MRVWADHQKTNGETELKCPLCREKFCSFELLEQEYRNNGLFKMEKQDLHYGLCCQSCKATPISGKCYKCTSCPEFYLCQSCFNTNFHRNHQFVFREVITESLSSKRLGTKMIERNVCFLENQPEVPQGVKRLCGSLATSHCEQLGHSRDH